MKQSVAAIHARPAGGVVERGDVRAAFLPRGPARCFGASRRESTSAFRPAAAPLFASHGLVLCSWVHGKRRYDVSENWPLFIMRRP